MQKPAFAVAEAQATRSAWAQPPASTQPSAVVTARTTLVPQGLSAPVRCRPPRLPQPAPGRADPLRTGRRPEGSPPGAFHEIASPDPYANFVNIRATQVVASARVVTPSGTMVVGVRPSIRPSATATPMSA